MKIIDEEKDKERKKWNGLMTMSVIVLAVAVLAAVVYAVCRLNGIDPLSGC